MIGMTIPVVRTFVHFGRRPLLVRSCSAPAELRVDLILARARERERLLERRRKKTTKKLAEKWEAMIEKAWKRQNQLLLESVRDLVADQLSRTTPRMRERLETRLLREFACVLLPDEARETLLLQMGVLRKRADEVQFWCGDDPMGEPVMQILLAYARTFREVAHAGDFQINMAGEPFIVIKLRGAKREDVRRLVEKRWRIPPRLQALQHLGQALKHGLLEDQGLAPGACVQVTRRA